MKHKTIIILIICLFGISIGQDYHWPTKSGKRLSSNFGEFRDGHFHMGIDVRTNGQENYRIYAVSDGYIYRIATNFNGYGKALYLKTDDDKIVLYGHLNRYSPALENELWKLQREKKSYFVNKYFTRDKIPVKRGDIIGFSGNTGGSMGPHVHFELRDSQDHPLNPLTNGFPVPDTVPPQIRILAVIPFTTDETSPPAQFIKPQLISPGIYTIIDTINITGTFGLSGYIVDKINNASNTYQAERIELSTNDSTFFSLNFGQLDFSEGKHVNTTFGKSIISNKNRRFHKLYRLPEYPKLSIHTEQNGIFQLKRGIHKIKLQVWDSAQNHSILTMIVNIVTDEKFDLSNVNENYWYTVYDNPNNYTISDIYPENDMMISSADGQCIIQANNAVYYPVALGISKIAMQSKYTGVHRSNIYKIQPSGITFKNPIEVQLTARQNAKLDRCAVYSYNKNKSKWGFLSNKIDLKNNIIAAKLAQPATVAILEDTTPPDFIYSYPKNGAKYSRNSLRKFIININDNLSGIASDENSLVMKLDGIRLWAAYQPMKKQLSYRIHGKLTRGVHKLLISVKDRAGNTSQKAVKFYVE